MRFILWLSICGLFVLVILRLYRKITIVVYRNALGIENNVCLPFENVPLAAKLLTSKH